MQFSILSDFPSQAQRVIRRKGTLFISCPLRSSLLVLTPEEWVRQHWIGYLLEKNIPRSALIAERLTPVEGMSKRLDLLWLKKARPFVLFEFKAPRIEIHISVFEQIARYNHHLGCPWLVISNGLEHQIFCYDYENRQYKNWYGSIDSAPFWD